MDLTVETELDSYLSARRDIDTVIHLASNVHFKVREQSFFNNIYGTHLLLRKMQEFGIGYLLFASGNNVYSPAGPIYTEDSPMAPGTANYYAISKYFNEADIEKQTALGNIKSCIFRIADIYGPHQSQGNLLNALLKNTAEGLPLLVYGKGDRTRDYIYIEDVVAGIQLLLNKKAQGVYNLSTGIGTTVAELTAIFAQLSGGRCPLERKEVAQEDLSKIVLDCSRIKALGFQPQVTVADGMKRLLEAYQKEKGVENVNR